MYAPMHPTAEELNAEQMDVNICMYISKHMYGA